MTTVSTQTQPQQPLPRNWPEHCRAAVFERPGKALSIREIPIPPSLETHAILCKVAMSTICGSDLHTLSGRRPEPVPSILGHEIVGRITACGDDALTDFNGDRLRVGDRVTWSIAASCGLCRYCTSGIPQKCERVRKYGHLSLKEHPHLTGGYSEYIYIMPGTAVFKVPSDLPDPVLAPVNCTLATAVNAVKSIQLGPQDTVLVQGAGLLGLYICALAKSKGCSPVIVTDTVSSRLEMAKRFGADCSVCVREHTPDRLAERIMSLCGGNRLSAVFEACGARDAARVAIEVLDIAGRLLIAGLVTPGSLLDIDANKIVRKYLTIKGIHNYHPEDLGVALEFVRQQRSVFAFEEIVGMVFPLDQINQAVEEAASGRHIRVGVRP
jgi:alcohol dehydrogenase